MPSEELAIRFESVCCAYGHGAERVEVLRELELDVRAGETLCLVGPSGSGKSSALRLVNRLHAPSDGRVHVQGTPVEAWDPIRLRRTIGYVLQAGGLFPHLTVRENVELLCRLEGWSEGRRRARSDALLERVRLEPARFADRFPAQLSGGQAQRVAVARALALDPPILLMDEPFGALDPLTRAHLQGELGALAAAGERTVLFVSHDLREAFRLGDRVAVLAEGRLVRLGTPDELLAAPGHVLVERYLEETGLHA